MTQEFEKAHADWPDMTLLPGGGIHLTGRYVHPSLALRAGLYFSGVVFLLMIAAAGHINDEVYILLPVLAAICWFIFLRKAVYAGFGRKLDVKIFPDRIALAGWSGTRTFSRATPIEFRVERHREALHETGKMRLYRDALEVVMQYGEKRIPLAEMPDKNIDQAHALVIRLQNVCDSIDMALSIAGTNKLTPAASGDFGPVPDIR